MTVEVAQENFEILFDEENNFVEIVFQGLSAAQLALLQSQLNIFEGEVNGQFVSVNGTLASLVTDVAGINALQAAMNIDLTAESAARLAADSALGADISANLISLTDQIQDEINNRAAALLQEAADRNAAIASATGTIVSDVAAMAITIEGLATSLGGAEANIITIQEAISTETAARAAQYSLLQADYANANAAILNESLVRATAVDALAVQIDAISASTGTTVFTQPDEPTTGMSAGDIWYDTDDGNKPYRYNGTAWIDVSDFRITQNQADIANEIAVRTSLTDAQASSISLLQANLAQEIIDRDAADGTLSLAINVVEAAILTEQNARVTAVDAVAQSVTELTATVNDNTAAVEAETLARVTADGVIEAKYGVKVDANGHVAGFGLIATVNEFGVGDSSFIVNANNFQVFNGTSGVSPFTVSGGVVYMTNVKIQNAVIESLSVGKLTTGTFANGQLFSHNGDINVGSTGKIRGGKTVFGSGTGFILGYSGGSYIFDIGDNERYMRWDGDILTVSKLQVLDGFLNNTPLGPSSARIITSGAGHSAPFNAYDMASFDTESSQAIYVQVGPFYAPDEGSGFARTRVAFRKSDFVIQCNWSCNSNTVPCYVQYRYKIGGSWAPVWTTLATVNVKGDNRGSAHANLRFTSSDVVAWQEIQFRTYTGNANCFAAALRVDCLNAEESNNAANSSGYRIGSGTAISPATSVLGSAPTPPTWTPDPTWDLDRYFVAP